MSMSICVCLVLCVHVDVAERKAEHTDCLIGCSMGLMGF